MNLSLLARRNYQSLSIRDLLEAREIYHVHLAHLDNVVATAIGRKRFLPSDLDALGNLKYRYDHNGTGAAAGAGGKRQKDRPHYQREKRLDNTVSPRWAWPCVLVFVRNWIGPNDPKPRPDQIVPEFLYMPDGRVVPTCVLRLIESDAPVGSSDHVNFPSTMVGGGYVAVTDVQGKEHIGSIGCLVTDGDSTYALTNRHVTGAGGREIFTVVNGSRVRLGISAESQIGKRPFDEVYRGWPGTRSFVNVDAGLIRIDDTTKWTTQVYGIGEIAEPLDLNPDTISLDLIGCNVCAYGAASGEMEGQIQALFYRYKSIGGFDYVCDLLIGGSNGKSLRTLPGDSGTLWFFKSADNIDGDGKQPKTDEKNGAKPARGKRNGRIVNDDASTSSAPGYAPRLHPIAIQWGGHVLMDSTDATHKEFTYALGTCLSTVCRELDVDVVRDWNLGHVQYWGEMGHYSIGLKACGIVSQSKLKKLMKANAHLVGFNDQTMKDPNKYKIHSAKYSFVPLADVADDVWRINRMGANGKNNDSNNHFADMDQEDAHGKTLLKLSEDPDNIDPQVWLDFYNTLSNGNGDSETNAGALPFRVWQMYDEAVEVLQKNHDVPRWLCLMGTMAHYVGDACQPLHVSKYHHGIPPVKKGSVQYKVHSVYESEMLDTHPAEIIDGLNSRLKNVKVSDDGKRGGHEAAVLVVALMRQTVTKIAPKTLVTVYNNAQPSKRVSDLWDAFSERTMDRMAESCKTLAMLWERAWVEGGGPSVAASKLKAVQPGVLEQMYRHDPTFARSMSLENMISEILAALV